MVNLIYFNLFTCLKKHIPYTPTTLPALFTSFTVISARLKFQRIVLFSNFSLSLFKSKTIIVYRTTGLQLLLKLRQGPIVEQK
jgi:hypothetical protein